MKYIHLVMILAVFTALTGGGGTVHAFNRPLLSTQKSIGYFVLPDTAYTTPSSGFAYDFPANYFLLGKQQSELTYFATKNWYLYPEAITRVGFHNKHALLDLWGIQLTGFEGLGLLYSKNVGTATSVDFGGIVTLPLSESFRASLPIALSVFSDGVMGDISPQLALKPFSEQLELTGGALLNFVGITENGKTAGGSFRIYYLVGLRHYL